LKTGLLKSMISQEYWNKLADASRQEIPNPRPFKATHCND